MQLQQLKLAGFKSFVDPTILTFPSPLVAVVGPNGCGKSNIIDAIRWVMGESSAKNLRGDSMIDVIFNGSSQRKPVGQASVELVFDNSLGRVIGSFANYGEIAVKRVLTRDGDSTYYLNGTRCRRRDVMDIFLGTGAGVRGYSIISQGDVSRLIEAKPEALRGFLEEAAGVSKYKERRRETILRIEHTRENLVRIADIRDELGKQLLRLEKQAKSAERYVQLKKQEHLCRAEILALKWRDLTAEQLLTQTTLQNLIQSHQEAQLTAIQQQKEKDLSHLKQQSLDIQYQDHQVTFYKSGTEITRLQEGLAQFQRDQNRLENTKQQLQTDYETADRHILNYKSSLIHANEHKQILQEQSAQLKLEKQQQELLLQTINEQKIQTDKHWHALLNRESTLKHQTQINTLNWSNNEQKKQQTTLRIEKLTIEAASMDIATLIKEASRLNQQQTILSDDHNHATQILAQAQEKFTALRQQLSDIEHQLRQAQDQNHQTKTQHAALSAAQGAATHSVRVYPIEAWVDNSRLVDIFQVEKTWQLAFECVLGDNLKALVLNDAQDIFSHMQVLSEIGENIITIAQSTNYPPDCLAAKIQQNTPLIPLSLTSIYTAEDLNQAQLKLASLPTHASVITPEGYWLGHGWVRIPKLSHQDQIGLLVRQQQIIDLSMQLDVEHQQLDLLREQRDSLQNQLQCDEKYLYQLQANVHASLDALRQHEAQAGVNAKGLQYTKTRQKVLDEEQQELQLLLEEVMSEQYKFNQSKSQLAEQTQILQQEKLILLEHRNQIIEQVLTLQKSVEAICTSVNQNTLELDRVIQKIQQMQEGITQEQHRLETFTDRLAIIQQSRLDSESQHQEWQKKLVFVLDEHHKIEVQLQFCKEHLVQQKQISVQLEKNAKKHDGSIKTLEDKINQQRLEEHSLAIRIQNILESLDELSLKIHDLLINLKENVTVSLRESTLSVIMVDIAKLGAINLAAIEECAEERLRKTNLDEQYADLQEALFMLESAIDKMDKETELRLKNTFDQVNKLFKALFPRLFGGGKAQLELTSDNLLEAGVVVMAQPPGKRNSTIQLLSGGEKAMTAIALVFAIFQLNPSPFCMLDEVDAPLDDINVGRFCSVVKEMSQFVQFLFITHNKVTMELAEQLIGVTMREPGVSRLVTVDINKTIAEI